MIHLSLKKNIDCPDSFPLIEISGISGKVKVIAKVVVNFLAKKGLMAGLVTGGGIVVSKIPATAISTYLRDAFPQNLPHLEKKRWGKNLFRPMRPKPRIFI